MMEIQYLELRSDINLIIQSYKGTNIIVLSWQLGNYHHMNYELLKYFLGDWKALE